MNRLPPLPLRGLIAAFTLIELLVVMAVIGILVGIVAVNFRGFQKASLSDARAIAVSIKAARSQAMATTSAARVRFDPATRALSVQRAETCAATSWTAVGAGQGVVLAPGVQVVTPVSPAPWVVCFDSRGLASPGASLSLRDQGGGAVNSVVVYLGGAVQVNP